MKAARVPAWFVAAVVLLLLAFPFAEFMNLSGPGWLRDRSPLLLRTVVGALLFLVNLVVFAWTWGFTPDVPRGAGERWARAVVPPLFAILISWLTAKTQGGMEAFLDETRTGVFDWILFACGIGGAVLGAVLAGLHRRAPATLAGGPGHG